MILEHIVKKASHILKNHGINSYELDAELILSNIIGVNREVLITSSHIDVPKKVRSKYNQAIKRRINNEPIAYILERKEFWSRNFKVNKAPNKEYINFSLLQVLIGPGPTLPSTVHLLYC